MKRIRRKGSPVGRVVRPGHWIKTGSGAGGGATGPAFHALTYDPDTYEMLGVKTGTGDLTTTHADTLYAPDYEGVQRAFGADEPVWAGGRVVDKSLIYSDDFSNARWAVFNTTLFTGRLTR